MDDLARDVRKFIYDRIRETSHAPVIEESMRRFGLARGTAREVIGVVEANRQVVLLKGTDRILMAHPFSAVPTPFRVTLDDGQAFFANCSWDAIAMHVMLEAAVAIDSFCHHCGEKIAIELSDETVKSKRPEDPIVYLGLPAAKWWEDVVHTCSNTMVFFASDGHRDDWITANGVDAPGQSLDIGTAIGLSRPIYRGKMERGYERPSLEELRRHFADLGLTGPFWAL